MSVADRLTLAHRLVIEAEEALAGLPPAPEGSDVGQSALIMLQVARKHWFPVAASGYGMEGEPFGPIPRDDD